MLRSSVNARAILTKVGIVASDFCPKHLDAICRSAWEISIRLTGKGYNFIIITNGRTKKEYKINGIQVFQIRSPRFFASAKEIIEKLGVDIVHFYGGLSGAILFSRTLKNSGKPLVLSLYMSTTSPTDFCKLRLSDLFRGHARLLLPLINMLIPSFFIRRNFRNVDKIILLEMDKRLDFPVLKKKIVVVPHGVDFSKFANYDKARACALKKELGFNDDEKVILYFGHSYPTRGIEELVSAFPSINQEYPKARLLLVITPTPYSRHIQEMVSKMSLSGSVRIVRKWVGTPENYIGVSDVVVVPYRFKDVLRLPFALLEAMAAGKPVIVTNLDFFRRFIKNERDGLVVRTQKKEDLVSAVLQFLRDEPFAERCGHKAQLKVKALDWGRVTEEISEIYSKANAKKKNKIVKESEIRFKFDIFSKSYEEKGFKRSLGLRYLSWIEKKFVSSEVHTSAKKALDIGVGTGRNMQIMLQKGLSVYGVDVSRNMMNMAMKKARDKDAFFISSDAKSLPFRRETFDIVTCIRVLKYIPRWEWVIKESSRVLRSGGKMILSFPNIISAQFLSSLSEDYFCFKISDVSAALARNGFRILRMERGSIMPFPLYRRIAGNVSLRFFLEIERILGTILPNHVFRRTILVSCVKD